MKFDRIRDMIAASIRGEREFKGQIDLSVDRGSIAWSDDEYDLIVDELMPRARGLLIDIRGLECQSRKLDEVARLDAVTESCVRHLVHVFGFKSEAAFRDAVSAGSAWNDDGWGNPTVELFARALSLEADLCKLIDDKRNAIDLAARTQHPRAAIAV
jgi:hypothetical protein